MLFTDIEGSTRLARQLADSWPEVLAAHHEIVGGAIREAAGHIEGREGDSFFAAFPTPRAAVAAAIAAQRALRAAAWPTDFGELRVRMGIHTAHIDRFDDQYVGLEVHRAARVASAAHGGQVILTSSARAAVAGDAECDDLGSHRLKDFPEPTRLFHLVFDGRKAGDYPPPATLGVHPTNLPPTAVAPLGRAKEIDLVRTALVENGSRIVTLTGMGGAGKTTTALAVGRSLLDDYPGGVWLVRAEALTDSNQLVTAIQDVLWVRDRAGAPLLAVAERLVDRKVLLVVDNLEQLPEAGQLLAELVALAPTVAVLATSRAPLGLVGEQVVVLGRLPIDSARQLLQRGARGLGSIALRDSNPSALDDLCERLDCLPLALELIAPRLRVLSAQQVLERLGPVGDLATIAPDRPERQRSLRATVEWTMALLPADARTLLIRLTCFHAAAPLDLVEEVCGFDLDVGASLEVLVDYSLVEHRVGGFAPVAAVRDVVATQLSALGDEHTVRLRHATALAAYTEPDRQLTMSLEDQRTARELEMDGWIATVWAREHATEVHRSLVIGLGPVWATAGHFERVFAEVGQAMNDASLTPLDESRLLRVRSYAEAQRGRADDAIADAERAVRLAAGSSLADEARALIVLSQAQNVARQYEVARDSALTAAECLRRFGNVPLLVKGLTELAQADLAVGLVADAAAVVAEAAELADGHSGLVAMVGSYQADVYLASGAFAAAIEANVRLLEWEWDYEAWSVAAMAVAFHGLGEARQAVEVGTVAVMMARERGIDPRVLTQMGEDIEAVIAKARALLSREEATAAEQAGRRLPAGQRVARVRALGLSHLGLQHEGS